MNPMKDDLLRQLQLARSAVRWKLEWLGDYDLRRPMTPTGTNLLGVVKHLAMVELGYFGEVFGRTPAVSVPWWASDEALMYTEPNVDLYATAEQSREEVLQLYREAEQNTAATVAALDLDAPGRVPWWGEHGQVTLHRILVHMLAEVNRHAGHLDILRESIDGAVGHRPGVDNLAEGGDDFYPGYRAKLQAIADGFRAAGRS